MSVRSKRLADVEADFKRYTAKHVLEAIDEGAGMRRLVVREPGTWHFWFTITTWPNYLAITGDLGSYVFCRIPDMFQFFRQGAAEASHGINPDYWSEKVVAADRHGIEQWSIESLRESLQESLDESKDDEGRFTKHSGRYQEMLARLQDFSDAPHDQHGALEAMGEFEGDAYERNHTVYTVQFLNCLHAIVLGIRLYDEYRAKRACDECGSCRSGAPKPGGVRACPRCDHELCTAKAVA